MSAPSSQTQWYLARDGQQFGPLSEAELAKFIDLGHMQPTDLLWRDGFPDWRPAMVVFPQRKPQAPRPAQPGPPRGVREPAAPRPAADPRLDSRPGPRPDPRLAPMAAPSPAHAAQAEVDDAGEEPRADRSGLRRGLFAAVWMAVVAAAGWYAYPHRAQILGFVKGLAPTMSGSPVAAVDAKSLKVPPLKGFVGPPDGIDGRLQATALWRVLKRDFPDWYADRLKEAAALSAEGKDDAVIGQQMARGLVALRRQNVNHALGASFPRLKAVAITFHDNLVELKKLSSDACFAFISQGEASPAIVAMLQGSDQVASLQSQLTAVFEAVADGRKSTSVYPQPRKTDYDVLAGDLKQRGWTQADIQLFSDERALARASPEKVCQLVHDWFAAQLAITDPDVQLRLLVDSLKPVVAG